MIQQPARFPPDQYPYAAFDAVALAASTGGLAAVSTVLGALPADFPAAVIVVLHRATGWGDGIAAFLARRTALEVTTIDGNTPLRPGTVYVCPPDRQSLAETGPGLVLGLQQRCRADELFTSLADVLGSRALGVVLTGRLDDGAEGARAIKGRGGRVIAQDPATAAQLGMPSAAISTGCVDWVLPLDRIAHALVSLVMWPGAAELLRVPSPPWARITS
jgi:two-component system chemotaxis response regulator CheB